jgi:hypothetical protein
MVSGRDHSWTVFGADMTTFFVAMRLRLGRTADRAVARLVEAGTGAEPDPKAALGIDVGRPCLPTKFKFGPLSQFCGALCGCCHPIILSLPWGETFQFNRHGESANTVLCYHSEVE